MAKRKASGKKRIRAPHTTRFRNRVGGPVSFELYFLRDLYANGYIDDKLLQEIIEQNEIAVDFAEVIAAIKDASGTSIPPGLARQVADIAVAIVGAN
jgi:hypothetical protein